MVMHRNSLHIAQNQASLKKIYMITRVVMHVVTRVVMRSSYGNALR